MTATILIGPTTAETIERDGGELLHRHWDEVALNKDVMVLRPRWDVYQRMQATNQLIVMGAWSDDELIGYSASFITQHLHYASMTYAQNDVLFVAPEHRKTSVGIKLMRATEAEAKHRGAKLMLWHAKEHSRLDDLLKRMSGYAVQDIIYSRKL